MINPKKECEINEGRKRIDITYSNGKDSGLFYRVANVDQHLLANTIHVECKNYTNEISNPEVDQLMGRFDNLRGRFGLLMFRESDALSKLKSRCRVVAKQKNGVILPIDDKFIIKCLDHVENNDRKSVDIELDKLFQNIIS